MTSTPKPTTTTSATTTTMNHHHHHQPSYGTDPNTTFVQAEPANFRSIVQKLTGAPPDSTTTTTISSAAATTSAIQKLPLTPKRPAFKLHERRQSAKNLELKLHNITNSTNNNINNDPFSLFRQQQHQQRGFNVSPVSHLDHFWARVSPGSTREEPHAPEEEEQRAIAEKGFYLHRSPLSTPREAEPELLPLFPLQSPKNNQIEDNDGDSS